MRFPLFGKKRSNRRDPEVFLQHLREQDERLVAAGFIPIEEDHLWPMLEDFIRSGKRRLTWRKPRKIGASTIVGPRWAVAEALFGEHPHSPGEPPHTYAFLSVSRDEAGKRLRGVKAILDVIGEPYSASTDAIELKNKPARFVVMTASFRTAVGDTVPFAWCDELARWHDEEKSANPAKSIVDDSLAPAGSTLLDSHIVLVSTPLADTDFHAECYRLGDTPNQMVAGPWPSWEVNPTLSEQKLREEFPDERLFLRNCLGQPTATVSTAFEDIDSCISWGDRERPWVNGITYGMTFDAGETTSNTVAMVFHFEYRQLREDAPVSRVLVVDACRVLKSSFFKTKRISFDETVALIVDAARDYRVEKPRGDRHVHSPLGSALANHGIRIPDDPMPMGLADQARRSQLLIDRVRARTIDVLPQDDLVRQLRAAVLVERSGSFIVKTSSKRTTPDDALDCLLLAQDEKEFGKLPATGGDDLVHVPGRVVFNGPSLTGVDEYFLKRTASGGYQKVGPPRTHPDYEAHREARIASGTHTLEDEKELGPERIRELLERGHATSGGSSLAPDYTPPERDDLPQSWGDYFRNRAFAGRVNADVLNGKPRRPWHR